MTRAKGAQFSRVLRRQASWLAVLLSAAVFMLPVATRAAFAGVWQTPLTYWLVDGFQFGEYVGWNPSTPYHLGADAHGDPGTPVYAAANGTVRLARDMSAGRWGGIILVEHAAQSGEKVVSLHGHLDAASFQIVEGQSVNRGQLLGYLGDENTNGYWVPHLHYGIRNGRYIDAYAGEEWVYWGYGDEAMLADWFNPTDYINSHKNVIEVQRVPSESPNRFTTAVGVSQRRFPKAQSVASVILADGNSFADALAAAPLTSELNGPLLLATKDSLPSETKKEIQRVLAKGGTVRMLGGLSTLSYAVEESINKLGIHTERISGANREATAVKIARHFPEARAAFIVNRDSFADSVSAGGAANINGMPLLFTGRDALSSTTATYLKKTPTIEQVYVIGGPSAISADVVAELRTITSIKKMARLFGPDRYETNLAVAKNFTPNPDTLIFATGENFPDALTGSSLSSPEKGSLLLTRQSGYSSSALSFINEARPDLDAALVLGGTTAVSATVDSKLASALNAPLTLASHPIESHSDEPTKPLTLSSSATVSLAGVSVPAIDGLSLQEKALQGGVVASLTTGDLTAELAPPVTISRIPLNDTTPTQVLAEWFGVTQNYIAAHQTSMADSTELTAMPTIMPAHTTYYLDGTDIVLVELRLPAELEQPVLQQITEQL